MNTKNVLIIFAILAVTILPVSGKDFGSSSAADMLRDYVSASVTGQSTNYVQTYAEAIAGENSEATIVAESYGDYVSLISNIYMETDNPATGEGEIYVYADEYEETGATSSASPTTISITTYGQGVGDAHAYACSHGWERFCDQ